MYPVYTLSAELPVFWCWNTTLSRNSEGSNTVFVSIFSKLILLLEKVVVIKQPGGKTLQEAEVQHQNPAVVLEVYYV